ncbi:MAG: 3D domain-containing protein [Deltaproteobacteria bacterium]|nr:3D domain-containing protein [Candidatus Zymogenaceae bacterium]
MIRIVLILFFLFACTAPTFSQDIDLASYSPVPDAFETSPPGSDANIIIWEVEEITEPDTWTSTHTLETTQDITEQPEGPVLWLSTRELTTRIDTTRSSSTKGPSREELEALASGDDAFMEQLLILRAMETGRFYERIFRVTGYYSPLPGQNRYVTGSYAGDIRLNGKGVMAADKTPVYLGMAAGPPFMKYGTKVILQDLRDHDLPGVYTVHDRGSAIVGDRLDIWVGEGEEAIKKAFEITGYYRATIIELD